MDGRSVPVAATLRACGTIVGWAGTLATVLLLAALLLLRVEGVQPLSEQSASMAPLLEPGDLLLVSRAAAAQVRPGDVITFRDPYGVARTVTHRVLRVARAGDQLRFTTRGDANRTVERWTIPVGGSVGRLRASVPGAGRVMRPVADRRLRGLLVAALSALTAALSLQRIWRRRV